MRRLRLGIVRGAVIRITSVKSLASRPIMRNFGTLLYLNNCSRDVLRNRRKRDNDDTADELEATFHQG